jgi:hypothetical protein
MSKRQCDVTSESVCSHCGSDWTESGETFNGGCCAPDQEHDPLMLEADPEPCTDAAMAQGCACYTHGSRWDIDPPEPRIAQHCPLHGRNRDPDRLRELRAERAGQ